MGPRAASIAAAIHKTLGLGVTLELGAPGQLDIFVDDEFLIGKDEKAGLWEHLFGNRGFPTPEKVVGLLQKRLKTTGRL